MFDDLKIYSQYDYDNNKSYSEARIHIPSNDDCFLLERPDYSTSTTRFSGHGINAKDAVNNLVEKLEDNAKVLQQLADQLKNKG